MASINTVTISGNLTRDPEIRHWPDGRCSVTFTVAVNTYLGKDEAGEAKERAEFVPVRLYNAMGKSVADKFRKGMPITVSGSLRLEKWEKDGKPQSMLIVQGQQVAGWPRESRDSIPGGEPPTPGTSSRYSSSTQQTAQRTQQTTQAPDRDEPPAYLDDSDEIPF